MYGWIHLQLTHKAVVFSVRIFHCFKPKNNKKFQRTNICDSYTLMLLTNPPYGIFPLLRIFPTYLSYTVNKTSQHLNYGPNGLTAFSWTSFASSAWNILQKRTLCYASQVTCFKQIWLNISNVYLQTPWFQCDLLDDWHKNLWGGWSKSTSKYCSDLTLRILLPLSHFSLSDKTTVWLLHMKWLISIF